MPDNDSNDTARPHIPLAKDTLVGHCRIVEKIGAGGMGEVYLAEDTELNRKVALKFLPPHMSQDADCRARFKREAQAAAKLNHSNIVTIHEVSEFDGRPFFAMEHLEGLSLSEYLKDRTPSWQEVLGLAIQLAEGLGEAHRSGVVHRDIKPSNILVDARGRAKILDFGLATIKGEKKLTKTGSTTGTLHYMSPEQTRGEPVDERSDIFSFGVVLYEMITGQAPFRGEHEPAILYAIAYDEPEPLARYKSGVSQDCQRIVSKALAKDKALRYQHADELAADLKGLMSSASAPIVARKRSPRLLVPSAVALGLLVAALVFKPWQIIIRPSQEASAASKRVLVIPFQNQTGDPSLDPLGKMVADWTIQSLLETGLAEIVPSGASLGLDARQGIGSIADATGATTIVTGSYYKLGDSIQFQAQVSDATEKLLQAVEPIHVSTSKVMDGVESVRQRVLGALALVLDKSLHRSVAGQIPNPPKYEAYLQFMQGVDIFHQKSDYAGSIPYFARAGTLDSTFVFPLLMTFYAYHNLGQYAQADSIITILESRRSQLSARQQVEMDQQKAQLSGDWMTALKLFRAENKQFPQSANWYMVGVLAIRVNRPREAVEALQKETPDERTWAWYWTHFAEAYHMLGEHEKELEKIREGRRRFPTQGPIYNRELGALAALGEITKLRRLLEDRPALDSSSSTPAHSMTIAAMELRAHGHEHEAMKLLEKAIRWYESQPPEIQDSSKNLYAFALYQARRWNEAGVVFEELARILPRDSADGLYVAAYIGLTAARQGDRAKAMEVSEWFRNLKLPYRFGLDTYARACIAAVLGDKAQAVALLRESFLQGFEFNLEVHRDVDFESLWEYPPFMELLRPKG